MNIILGIALALASILSLFSLKRKQERLQIFKQVSIDTPSSIAILESKMDELKGSFWQNLIQSTSKGIKKNYDLLISNSPSKMHLIMILCLGNIIGLLLNHFYVELDIYIVIPTSSLIIILGMIYFIKRRVKMQFYRDFPEAINTMIGVISSGSSISIAFRECATRQSGLIGEVMREISNRFDVGESPQNVLLNSYRQLPFPEYYFFILTIMVNLDGGGELKDILNKLSKMISSNTVLAKIRDGKTAELRMTLMILAAMPPLFIFMLKGISEDTYNYLMYTDWGKYIIYYVITSELIGIIFIKNMISKAI
ncbi:type II secretion system F family protein [Frischella sp. Ac48]|uniref:type II secretion system F family protein n=1 Tax=Frischella sp. Ac48 TaxID=2804531 RepID=UPI001C7CF525|nr:type II secretion system F family protein [Frischella sp. Ac48]MBX4133810.1 type II secretion system F family protein [Frischella sp. Ac48]